MQPSEYTPGFFSITDDVTAPSTRGAERDEQYHGNHESKYSGPARPGQVPSDADSDVKVKEKKKFTLGLSFFTDMRWRIVLGVIFIIVAAFLFISVTSYFFSAADDQSELEGATLEQVVADSGGEIKNWGGPGGALAAHTIVTHGLGVGVIPLLIYLVVLGLGLLDVKKCNFWSASFKALLLAVTLSMVLGLLSFNAENIVPIGGHHGYYMNYLLLERFSWPGAIGVSIILVAAVVGVYFYDIAQFYLRLKVKWDNQRARRRARHEEQMRIMQDAREQLQDKENEGNGEQSDIYSPFNAEEKSVRSNPLYDFDNVIASQPDEAVGYDTENEDERITAGTQAVEAATWQEAERQSKGAEPVFMPVPDEESQETGEKTEIEVKESPEAEGADEEPANFVVKEAGEIEEGKADDTRLDPTAELSRFKMPTAELLESRPEKDKNVDIEEIEDKKNQIIEALSKFNIGIASIEATVGPTVTMYEIVPAEGVKIATIKRLEEDIAMALAALSTRIIAPIPGKSAIGIEVPNRDPRTVDVRTIFSSRDFLESRYELPLALGVTIDNRVYMADLAKMPHLLVAGATGKGKSVGMNVIINSLLFKKHPSELKLVLIDPKMVEFYPYRKIVNHYLAQVPDAESAIITDVSKALDTLNSLCVEMDDRYELLQKAEVVKITHYNDLYINKKLNPEKGHHFMPYIVVIVDEYADLLMTVGKEIEKPIARLAQKARAVGIHVIIATQRPSANIISGVIRGNFPARIAYKVTSNIDSNIILGNSGAFQLIGNGDMLVSQDGELQRVQCAFISTEEIKNVAQFVGDQAGFGEPMYLPDPPVTGDKNGAGVTGATVGEADPLLSEIARYVVGSGIASTSNIQRNYNVGYNRAGRIMDQLHGLGIVSAQSGSKPRDVLVDTYRLEEILSKL